MKRILAIIIAAVALAGCAIPGTHGNTGAPKSASFAGAKGVYTDSGTTARSVFGARAVVSSTSTSLGMVTTSGQTSTVTFTDVTGQSVTANVTQAMQLNPTYILLSLAWTDAKSVAQTGTFTGNLTTGALSEVSAVPENWPMIWPTATSMYYESGGGIWSADLATGATTELSSGAAVWNTNTWTKSATVQPWYSGSWVYADSLGNVYAAGASNSSALQGQLIKHDGSLVDFGGNSSTWNFVQDLPGTSAVSYVGWDLLDTGSSQLYLVIGQDVWNNDPFAVGGSTLTGAAIKSYPVTFDPESPGVISIASVPTSYAMITSGVYRTTHVGADSTMQRSILTNGVDTYSVSVTSGAVTITAWNTSAVPVSNTFADGSSAGSGGVTNWYYSGGDIYAGPTATTADINQVVLPAGGGTVSDPPLIAPSGTITAWSVVGGQIFYTDSSGTWKYDISSSTKSAYTGTVPQAVTQ